MTKGTRAGAPDGRRVAVVPWRRILVPEEHGVWGLWAVLGIALAPSVAGVALAVAGLAAVGAAAAAWLSWWVVALAVAMALRTVLMLRPGAPKVHPVRIGIVETLIGVVWIVALAATLPVTLAPPAVPVTLTPLTPLAVFA